MKKYKINFDLVNKIVNMNYNNENIVATQLYFTGNLIYYGAFHPNIENKLLSLDYYSLEIFSTIENFVIIQRHSLTDLNKNIIEKDVELYLNIFNKEYINNNISFAFLYHYLIDNYQNIEDSAKEGFFEQILKFCQQENINTTITLD